MSPEENADCLEALRRIREAEETGATTLDLSSLLSLNQLPWELERLASLQALSLSRCKQISDVTPLAGLTSLQTLDLSHCTQIRDLTPLAGLTSLQKLNLSHCRGTIRFAPLEVLLPTLKEIYLSNCQFEDLPAEVCGENEGQNVLAAVRAHYADLRAGQALDAEIKVLFLGNGGRVKLNCVAACTV